MYSHAIFWPAHSDDGGQKSTQSRQPGDSPGYPSPHQLARHPSWNGLQKQRLASADIPSFRREGNKQQFNHTEKVLSSVELALQSIDNLDIECAKASLVDDVTAIKERQKLIRIADRSDLGWGS